jgi:hypothetical protein
MKAQETQIWKQVEACEDLGKFKINEIARNLQQVIDDRNLRFKDDALMCAFVWYDTKVGERYWSDLYDVLMHVREEW